MPKRTRPSMPISLRFAFEPLDRWRPAPLRSGAVLQFSRDLGSISGPVQVRVDPERLYGDAPAPLGSCYESAGRYAAQAGGAVQYGWMLYESPGLYLRACHHAVHSGSAGLIDVS